MIHTSVWWILCLSILLSGTHTPSPSILYQFLDFFNAYITFKKKNVTVADHKLKITHMWRRWGTPQHLFLAFIGELEKQIIIKKTVEVGQ